MNAIAEPSTSGNGVGHLAILDKKAIWGRSIYLHRLTRRIFIMGRSSGRLLGDV